MILLRDSSPVPDFCKGGVLALGNFDGVHLGHQAILGEAVRRAHALGVSAGVLTFEPHPRRLLRPQEPYARILPLSVKLRLLRHMGLDFVRIIRFTRSFAELRAEDFVRQHLCGALQAAGVVTGEDFTFGYQRGGNVALLRLGTWGLEATSCAPVLLDGRRCSSTWLRERLAVGDVETAARLLARPYSISGRVQTGDRRGRELGFPTANIIPCGIFLPANGVYAVRAVRQGQIVAGVANLGQRPTFGGSETRLEVHCFDFAGDLYGQKLEVQFIRRIRGEQRFASTEALKMQIAEDCAAARRALF